MANLIMCDRSETHGAIAAKCRRLTEESDTFALGEDREVWNEDQEDELVNDLKECATEPQNDLQLDSIPPEAKALSKWIMVFLFFIQANYKLSKAVNVVSML